MKRAGLTVSRKGTDSLFPGFDTPDNPGDLEKRLYDQGYRNLAGVDEVGRGPLAGPVVAAAVILDPEQDYPDVTDSKKMSKSAREKAFWTIMKKSVSIGIGLVDQNEIDRTNILAASLKAMAKAVNSLETSPDYLLIDGNQTILSVTPQKAVPKGDGLCLSIGAASIAAKVVRDRMMIAYDKLFPQYGFAAHKGYGTKVHLEALKQFGPCPLHRLSFGKVSNRK